MADTNTIMDILRTIPDPEMPISIVDLGLIERVDIARKNGELCVAVQVLPTFVGCPALDMIAQEITWKVAALESVDKVEVEFIHDPPWSVDRITEEGRASLRAHGVTVPEQSHRLPVPGHAGAAVALRTSAVPCPFCASRQTRLESTFGPTRCRMIYYCDACRNSFEHMKRVSSGDTFPK